MQLQLAPGSFIDVAPVPATRRIASIDALRGFNIFWILGGDGAIWALDDMTADKGTVVSGVGEFLGEQLHHVALGRLHVLRFHLSAVHFRHRRRHRVLAVTAGGAGRADAGASARAAAGVAALRPRTDLLRRHQPSLGRHPLSRRAAAHRALLSVRVAVVPELEPARHGRRVRRAARRLLGADDLRAGARHRRRLVCARRQSRQLDRCALPAGPPVGQDARSGRTADRRCRRSVPACSACSPACC